MKILLFLLVLIVFSCKKEDEFVSCPEYDNLIGTWEKINGDLDMKIIFYKNGTIEEICDFERTAYFKADFCEVSSTKKYLRIHSINGYFNYLIDLEIGFDTLSFYRGDSNEEEGDFDKKSYFIKEL